MPRRQKPRTEPPVTGIGLDPEAEATERANSESPEGEALLQELKRMEAVAQAQNLPPLALTDPSAVPDPAEVVDLADPPPPATNGDVPALPTTKAEDDDDDDEDGW